MADEKNLNKGKESWLVRTGRWFKKLPKRIATPFKNMWHELRKVTWPTKREMINYSLVVFGFMIIMTVIIGVFDFAAGALVNLIVNL